MELERRVDIPSSLGDMSKVRTVEEMPALGRECQFLRVVHSHSGWRCHVHLESPVVSKKGWVVFQQPTVGDEEGCGRASYS